MRFPSAMNRRRLLLGLAGLALPSPALAATGAARRLALVHADSGERFAGPLDGSALAELAHFLRDRREERTIAIDPELPRFIADVTAAIGAREATLLSGYRTAATNALLIKRKFPAAEGSLHIHGEAVDVTFTKRLADAAAAARKMKRGGVGWYPTMQFVHLDVGEVRSWQYAGGRGGGDASASRGPLTVEQRLARHRALAKEELRARGR